MKKLTKIPSEFSLAKYNAVANFGCEEWFVNLEKRHELLASFNLCSLATKHGLADSTIRTFLHKRILKLLENPIIPVEDSGGLLYLSSDDAVISLKNKDFFEMLMCVHFHDESDYQNVVQLISTHCKPEGVELTIDSNLIHKRFWNEDISPELMAFAKVDLYASDDKLIEDFKAWIKTEKEKRLIGVINKNGELDIPQKIYRNSVSESSFKEWSKHKVLPYLDLTIWAKVNDLNLIDGMLGEALFPSLIKANIDTTDKLRHSTKSKADFLMDVSTLKILASQVKKRIKPDQPTVSTEDFLNNLKSKLKDTTSSELC